MRILSWAEAERGGVFARCRGERVLQAGEHPYAPMTVGVIMYRTLRRRRQRLMYLRLSCG